MLPASGAATGRSANRASLRIGRLFFANLLDYAPDFGLSEGYSEVGAWVCGSLRAHQVRMLTNSRMAKSIDARRQTRSTI